MTLVSHAQNGEDVVLARAFGAERPGFYIDVGASDPDIHSVTKLFYDRGWRGINIEPAEVGLESLKAARSRDVNLGFGVGAQSGSLTFYELPRQMTGCSTFSPELAQEYEEQGWEATPRTVEVRTLADICEQYAGQTSVDFLKIDVEGNEAEVLAGADFERFRPRVLVVEATVPGTQEPAHEAWEPGVIEARYRFTLFDGLNRFYVRAEDEQLATALSVPANFLDDYMTAECARWREDAESLRGELVESRTGIEMTREELRRARAATRDARSELAATRAALEAALRDQAEGAEVSRTR